jgi:hypothetical protein
MRPIRLLAAALAVAAILALPAAAGAKPRYHRYVAYVKGSQTTEWNQPYRIYDLACSTREWSEGNGKETVTFRSVRPQRLLVQQNGRSISFLYGVWNPDSSSAYGLHVRGTTNRSANAASGYEPGRCGNGPDEGHEEKFECGSRSRDWLAKFSVLGVEKLGLSLAGTNKSFTNCRIFTPRDAIADAMSFFPVHVDAAKLLKGGKTIVVNGSKSWDQPIDDKLRNPVSATTTATWQLRLKPVRK